MVTEVNLCNVRSLHLEKHPIHGWWLRQLPNVSGKMEASIPYPVNRSMAEEVDIPGLKIHKTQRSRSLSTTASRWNENLASCSLLRRLRAFPTLITVLCSSPPLVSFLQPWLDLRRTPKHSSIANQAAIIIIPGPTESMEYNMSCETKSYLDRIFQREGASGLGE